ncbi:hypothetical protein IQ238_19945 [Pleurocapsales cyanobacterium LEGE 06147]|nr:hypothetical protein [Pleurocapsales cyanobacterium LEGE 06147]
MPISDKKQQVDDFSNVLEHLGQADESQIDTALAERDVIAPGPQVTPEVINRLDISNNL